jgi:hypothetical protein
MRLDKTKDHQVSTGLNLDQLLQRQKWTCKISKEATDLPIQMLLWKIQGAYYMGDLDNSGSLNYREFENLFDIGRGPP